MGSMTEWSDRNSRLMLPVWLPLARSSQLGSVLKISLGVVLSVSRWVIRGSESQCAPYVLSSVSSIGREDCVRNKMLLNTGIVFAVICFFTKFASAQFPSDGYNETTTDSPLPTLPNLNSYIKDLDVKILADTMAELQWKVPEPIQPLQGAYAHYSASCMSKESGNVFFVQQQSSSPVTLRPLEPGIPYKCIVTFSQTLNSSRSERQEITFFTRQLAPSGMGFITDLKYARVNSSQVEFKWQGPTLTDARGFPRYDLVIREGRMDPQLAVHDLSAAVAQLMVVRNISVNDSSTIQGGLLSSVTYTVQVRVRTAGGKGQYTYPLVVLCSQCTESVWPRARNVIGKMNIGTLVALLVCLAAVSAMVMAAAVLLFVVARAYRRKRRLANISNEEDPIVIREEREGEEELGGTME